MKLSFYLISALLCQWTINAEAQETIFKVKEKEGIIEEYNVLKSDKSIKHGSYINYTHNVLGTIFIIKTGAYSYNKKDSIWNYYNNNQLIEQVPYCKGSLSGDYTQFYIDSLNWFMKNSFINNKGRKNDSLFVNLYEDILNPKITGQFADGHKEGIWSYFFSNGKEFFKFSYDENKINLSSDINFNEPVIYLGGGKIGLALEIIPQIADILKIKTNEIIKIKNPIYNEVADGNKIIIDLIPTQFLFPEKLEGADLIINFQVDDSGKLQEVNFQESPFSSVKEKSILKKIQLKENWYIDPDHKKEGTYETTIVVKLHVNNNRLEISDIQ